MNTKSAKGKGRELENFVVSKLRNSGLDSKASRNPGSGGGKQKGDIWNDLGLCIECKNTKKAPGKAEFEQVRREAMGYQTEVLVWHPPQMSMDESRVIININDFIDLLVQAKAAPDIKAPTGDLKWAIINARNSLKKLQDMIGS